MISTPLRQTATLLIAEAVTTNARRVKACAELQISERTLQRWMTDHALSPGRTALPG